MNPNIFRQAPNTGFVGRNAGGMSERDRRLKEREEQRRNRRVQQLGDGKIGDSNQGGSGPPPAVAVGGGGLPGFSQQPAQAHSLPHQQQAAPSAPGEPQPGMSKRDQMFEEKRRRRQMARQQPPPQAQQPPPQPQPQAPRQDLGGFKPQAVQLPAPSQEPPHGGRMQANAPPAPRDAPAGASDGGGGLPIGQPSSKPGGILSQSQYADALRQQMAQQEQSRHKKATPPNQQMGSPMGNDGHQQHPYLSKNAYAEELRQQMAEKEQAKKQHRTHGGMGEDRQQDFMKPKMSPRRAGGPMSKDDYRAELQRQMAERDAARNQERSGNPGGGNIFGGGGGGPPGAGDTRVTKQKAQRDYYEQLKRDEEEAIRKQRARSGGKGGGFALGQEQQEADRRKWDRQHQYAQELEQQIRVQKEQRHMERQPTNPQESLLNKFGVAERTGMYHDPAPNRAARNMFQPSSDTEERAQRDREKARAYAQELEQQIQAKKAREASEKRAREMDDEGLPWQQQAPNQPPMGGGMPGYGMNQMQAPPLAHQGPSGMQYPPRGPAAGQDLPPGFEMGPLGVPVRKEHPAGRRDVQKAYNQSPYQHHPPGGGDGGQSTMPGAMGQPPGGYAPYQQPPPALQQPPQWGQHQQSPYGAPGLPEGMGSPGGQVRRGQGLTSITGAGRQAMNPAQQQAQRLQQEALAQQIAEKEARKKKQQEEEEEQERRDAERIRAEQEEIKRKFDEEQERARREESRKAELKKQIDEQNRLKKEKEEQEKEEDRRLQEKLEREQRELQEQYEREQEEERRKREQAVLPDQHAPPRSPPIRAAANANLYGPPSARRAREDQQPIDSTPILPTGASAKPNLFGPAPTQPTGASAKPNLFGPASPNRANDFDSMPIRPMGAAANQNLFGNAQANVGNDSDSMPIRPMGAAAKQNLFGNAHANVGNDRDSLHPTGAVKKPDLFGPGPGNNDDGPAASPKGLSAFAKLGQAGAPSPKRTLASPGKIRKRGIPGYSVPQEAAPPPNRRLGMEKIAPNDVSASDVSRMKQELEEQRILMMEIKQQAEQARLEAERLKGEHKHTKEELQSLKAKLGSRRQSRRKSNAIGEPDGVSPLSLPPSNEHKRKNRLNTAQSTGIWHIPSPSEAQVEDDDSSSNFLLRAASEIEKALGSARLNTSDSYSGYGSSPRHPRTADSAFGLRQNKESGRIPRPSSVLDSPKQSTRRVSRARRRDSGEAWDPPEMTSEQDSRKPSLVESLAAESRLVYPDGTALSLDPSDDTESIDHLLPEARYRDSQSQLSDSGDYRTGTPDLQNGPPSLQRPPSGRSTRRTGTPDLGDGRSFPRPPSGKASQLKTERMKMLKMRSVSSGELSSRPSSEKSSRSESRKASLRGQSLRRAAGEMVTSRSSEDNMNGALTRRRSGRGGRKGTPKGKEKPTGMEDSLDIDALLERNKQKLRLMEEIEEKAEFKTEELEALVACHKQTQNIHKKNEDDSFLDSLPKKVKMRSESPVEGKSLVGNTRWVQRVKKK